MKRQMLFLVYGLITAHLLLLTCQAAGTVVSLSEPQPATILAGPCKPTFRWQPVSGAVSYQIQVALSESFGERQMVVEQTLEGESSISFQSASDLDTNTSSNPTYYWWVRASIMDGGMHRLASWSTVWSFHLWPAPQPLELENPAHGSRTDSLRPRFAWVDPWQYDEHRDRIQISEHSDFRRRLVDTVVSVDTNGGFQYPENLEHEKTYYWRVRFEQWVRTVQGYTAPGAWSPVSSFHVYLPFPPKVLLSSPPSGTRVSSSATFSWNPVPTATSYVAEVSGQEDFSTVALRLFPGGDSITAPLGFADGDYYWRVRARNARGSGEWSDAWRIHKSSVTPDPVILEKPDNGAVVNNVRPLFEWEIRFFLGEGVFQLQVSRSSGFTNVVFDRNDIPSDRRVFLITSDLAERTRYYWRMRQQNVADWGRWSEVRDFTVDTRTASSSRVTLRSPGNSSSADDIRVYFSWESHPADCERCHFQVSEQAKFESVFHEGFPSGRSLHLNLEPERRYFWRVRAEDEVGWGSGVRSGVSVLRPWPCFVPRSTVPKEQ